MPKTFTDDIAPALPSSIEGPFQVVDASDASSWIKVEPASARISIAGDARPTRSVATGYDRIYLTAATQYIGTTITARYVNSDSNGGFYVSPIRIPDDMDLGEPSNIKVLIGPLYNATVNGQVVRFGFAHTRVTLQGVASNGSITYDWDVPDDWTTSDYKIVTIDNGNGRTFEADTFAIGDVVGFRISRLGTAAEDTFNKAVKFAQYLQFEYTAKVF